MPKCIKNKIYIYQQLALAGLPVSARNASSMTHCRCQQRVNIDSRPGCAPSSADTNQRNNDPKNNRWQLKILFQILANAHPALPMQIFCLLRSSMHPLPIAAPRPAQHADPGVQYLAVRYNEGQGITSRDITPSIGCDGSVGALDVRPHAVLRQPIGPKGVAKSLPAWAWARTRRSSRCVDAFGTQTQPTRIESEAPCKHLTFIS